MRKELHEIYQKYSLPELNSISLRHTSKKKKGTTVTKTCFNFEASPNQFISDSLPAIPEPGENQIPGCHLTCCLFGVDSGYSF